MVKDLGFVRRDSPLVPPLSALQAAALHTEPCLRAPAEVKQTGRPGTPPPATAPWPSPHTCTTNRERETCQRFHAAAEHMPGTMANRCWPKGDISVCVRWSDLHLSSKHFVGRCSSFLVRGHNTPREALGRVPRVILGPKPVKVWVCLPHVDRNLVSDVGFGV
jgi:hypothetical protein